MGQKRLRTTAVHKSHKHVFRLILSLNYNFHRQKYGKQWRN